MATYNKSAGGTPSQHRTQRITAVAVGDQIDINEILGRPARGVKFFMSATTDVIEYKINNLIKRLMPGDHAVGEIVEIWSQGASHSTFSSTNALEHTSTEGLKVSSIQIDSLTLSVGTTIDIVVW